MLPQYEPYVAPFAPTGDRIEILLQLSNFHHYRGGILEPLLFGPHRQVALLNQQETGRNLFLVGSIFIMGLYHLGLFGLRRREKAPLYFGLFCLATTGITLFLWQPPIFAHYISRDWSVIIRSIFLLGIASVVGLALFVHALFPQEAARIVLRLIFGTGVLLGGLALLMPPTITTALVLTLTCLYSLGIVLVAIARKRAGAVIFLLGFLPFLAIAVNDVLFFNSLIQTGPLVSMGLFILIFAQAYLLSARFSNAFTQTEVLSEELRRSEAKYRAIFEDSKDVIFVAALDGRIEAVNPACFELLGYTRTEALGMNAPDFYADPADRARFQAAVAHTGSVTDFAVKLCHKDGHTLDCQVTAILRRDETGQTIGYQGIIHDVTAYKQAEAARQRVLALQDLNLSLEQRVEARTAALTEANAALQAEIEQRQMHQQEKSRLLKLAQQQSEHLRSMSSWLVEMQQTRRESMAGSLDEEIEQKMAVIRQNLGVLQSAAALEQDPGLLAHITDTIRLLAEMEIYLEQAISPPDESFDPADPLAGSPLLQLSPRERQVLKLMAEGRSNPEIADALTIRLNTVHTYLKRIRHKLDIQDIPGLVDFARQNGLLE